MSDLFIALLPPVPGEDAPWREVAAELAAYHYPVRIVPACPAEEVSSDLDLAGLWVAHCALELARDRTLAGLPVLLVARGGAGRFLAALGFAQRASRRAVAGYVLVDAQLPNPGVQDWPDAPVTFVGQSSVAALRGWDVIDGEDLATTLRDVAARSV